MFDRGAARSSGGKLGVQSVGIGLSIANLIWIGLLSVGSSDVWEDALFWYVDFWLNLFIGTIGILCAAYFLGQRAGLEILTLKRNRYWIGVKYGVLILWTGTLIGCSVEFMKELFTSNQQIGDMLYDYYFKPFYWITLFGIIPVIIIGMWFGNRIAKSKINS